MRFATFLLLFSLHAQASYRVHQLRLTRYDNSGKEIKKETVLSTLDHLQYEHVNGGYRIVKAELVDTWYCPGDTSRRALCEKPKLSPTRGPASTDPKRLPYGRQPYIP